MPHIPGHKLSADDLLGLGEGGGIGILEALLLGQKFQAVRRDDGSLFAFDRFTGKAEIAPSDSILSCIVFAISTIGMPGFMYSLANFLIF